MKTKDLGILDEISMFRGMVYRRIYNLKRGKFAALFDTQFLKCRGVNDSSFHGNATSICTALSRAFFVRKDSEVIPFLPVKLLHKKEGQEYVRQIRVEGKKKGGEGRGSRELGNFRGKGGVGFSLLKYWDNCCIQRF